MEDDNPFSSEFPDFSSGAWSLGSCSSCEQKDKVIETLKTEQASSQSNFKVLKRKIIATDQLLRQFKAKIHDCAAQEKQIEEWVRKYEKSQREVTVFEAQLMKALEDMEPMKKAKGELEQQMKKLEKEKEDLTNQLNTAQFLNTQYEMRIASMEVTHNIKEEATADSKKKTMQLENKVKVQGNRINKLQNECKALKLEATKFKRREKRLENRLKRTEEKLSKHLDILVENRLMTEKAKVKMMATVNRLDRNVDSDIGSDSDSESDFETDAEDEELSGKGNEVSSESKPSTSASSQDLPLRLPAAATAPSSSPQQPPASSASSSGHNHPHLPPGTQAEKEKLATYNPLLEATPIPSLASAKLCQKTASPAKVKGRSPAKVKGNGRARQEVLVRADSDLTDMVSKLDEMLGFCLMAHSPLPPSPAPPSIVQEDMIDESLDADDDFLPESPLDNSDNDNESSDEHSCIPQAKADGNSAGSSIQSDLPHSEADNGHGSLQSVHNVDMEMNGTKPASIVNQTSSGSPGKDKSPIIASHDNWDSKTADDFGANSCAIFEDEHNRQNSLGFEETVVGESSVQAVSEVEKEVLREICARRVTRQTYSKKNSTSEQTAVDKKSRLVSPLRGELLNNDLPLVSPAETELGNEEARLHAQSCLSPTSSTRAASPQQKLQSPSTADSCLSLPSRSQLLLTPCKPEALSAPATPQPQPSPCKVDSPSTPVMLDSPSVPAESQSLLTPVRSESPSMSGDSALSTPVKSKLLSTASESESLSTPVKSKSLSAPSKSESTSSTPVKLKSPSTLGPIQHGEQPESMHNGKRNGPVHKCDQNDSAQKCNQNGPVQTDKQNGLVQSDERSKLAQNGEQNGLVQNGEQNGLVENGEQSKLVQSGEQNGLVENGEQSKLVQNGEHNGQVHNGDQNGLVQNDEQSKLVQNSEHSEQVQNGEQSKLVQNGEQSETPSTCGSFSPPDSLSSSRRRLSARLQSKSQTQSLISVHVYLSPHTPLSTSSLEPGLAKETRGQGDCRNVTTDSSNAECLQSDSEALQADTSAAVPVQRVTRQMSSSSQSGSGLEVMSPEKSRRKSVSLPLIVSPTKGQVNNPKPFSKLESIEEAQASCVLASNNIELQKTAKSKASGLEPRIGTVSNSNNSVKENVEFAESDGAETQVSLISMSNNVQSRVTAVSDNVQTQITLASKSESALSKVFGVSNRVANQIGAGSDSKSDVSETHPTATSETKSNDAPEYDATAGRSEPGEAVQQAAAMHESPAAQNNTSQDKDINRGSSMVKTKSQEGDAKMSSTTSPSKPESSPARIVTRRMSSKMNGMEGGKVKTPSPRKRNKAPLSSSPLPSFTSQATAGAKQQGTNPDNSIKPPARTLQDLADDTQSSPSDYKQAADLPVRTRSRNASEKENSEPDLELLSPAKRQLEFGDGKTILPVLGQRFVSNSDEECVMPNCDEADGAFVEEEGVVSEARGTTSGDGVCVGLLQNVSQNAEVKADDQQKGRGVERLKSPSAGDSGASPIQTPSAGDSGASPIQTPSAGDSGASSIQSPTAGDSGASPVQSPSAGDSGASPIQSPSAGDSGASPIQSPPQASASLKNKDGDVTKEDKEELDNKLRGSEKTGNLKQNQRRAELKLSRNIPEASDRKDPGHTPVSEQPSSRLVPPKPGALSAESDSYDTSDLSDSDLPSNIIPFTPRVRRGRGRGGRGHRYIMRQAKINSFPSKSQDEESSRDSSVEEKQKCDTATLQPQLNSLQVSDSRDESSQDDLKAKCGQQKKQIPSTDSTADSLEKEHGVDSSRTSSPLVSPARKRKMKTISDSDSNEDALTASSTAVRKQPRRSKAKTVQSRSKVISFSSSGESESSHSSVEEMEQTGGRDGTRNDQKTASEDANILLKGNRVGSEERQWSNCSIGFDVCGHQVSIEVLDQSPGQEPVTESSASCARKEIISSKNLGKPESGAKKQNADVGSQTSKSEPQDKGGGSESDHSSSGSSNFTSVLSGAADSSSQPPCSVYGDLSSQSHHELESSASKTSSTLSTHDGTTSADIPCVDAQKSDRHDNCDRRKSRDACILSEDDLQHIKPCPELCLSEIEVDCKRDDSPIHRDLIRPEARFFNLDTHSVASTSSSSSVISTESDKTLSPGTNCILSEGKPSLFFPLAANSDSVDRVVIGSKDKKTAFSNRNRMSEDCDLSVRKMTPREDTRDHSSLSSGLDDSMTQGAECISSELSSGSSQDLKTTSSSTSLGIPANCRAGACLEGEDDVSDPVSHTLPATQTSALAFQNPSTKGPAIEEGSVNSKSHVDVRPHAQGLQATEVSSEVAKASPLEAEASIVGSCKAVAATACDKWTGLADILSLCHLCCFHLELISPLPPPPASCRKCKLLSDQLFPPPSQPAPTTRKKKKQKNRQKKNSAAMSDLARQACTNAAKQKESPSSTQPSPTSAALKHAAISTAIKSKSPSLTVQSPSLASKQKSAPSITNQDVGMQKAVVPPDGGGGGSLLKRMDRRSAVQSSSALRPAAANRRSLDGGRLVNPIEQAKREMMLRRQAAMESDSSQSIPESTEQQQQVSSLTPTQKPVRKRKTPAADIPSSVPVPTQNTLPSGAIKDKCSGETTEPRPAKIAKKASATSAASRTNSASAIASTGVTQKTDEVGKEAADNVMTKSADATTGNVSASSFDAGSSGIPDELLVQQVEAVIDEYYDESSLPAEAVMKRLQQVASLPECWLPVVRCIITILKRDDVDLQLDIVQACTQSSNHESLPTFMDPTEIRFMHLLLRMMESDPGCERVQLMQTLWAAIFLPNNTEKTSVTQRSSLCRLFVGLCGAEGRVEEVRALAFHIIIMNYPSLVTMVLAVAAVWPKAMARSQHTGLTGVLVVLEHIVMSTIAKTPASVKLARCFERLCSWVASTDDSTQVMAQHILALQIATTTTSTTSQGVPSSPSTSSSVYELSCCVEMLCANRGVEWTVKNFVERAVRSAIVSWTAKGEVGISPHYVAALCTLVGRVSPPELKNRAKVLTQLVHVQCRNLLTSPHAHPVVEAACTDMLLRLAPLKPPTIFSVLHDWIAARPGGAVSRQLKDRIIALRNLIQSRASHLSLDTFN